MWMMKRARMALLRGVCQLPAYVALEQGLFAAQGVEVEAQVAPTAWTIPDRLRAGDVDFAVMPWTRVAADAPRDGNRLVLIAGSGSEEAALVLRPGLAVADVRRVAVPQEGGIKDLTAMALLRRLELRAVKLVRQPSGDGAIISFVGEGADAAAMVEPYATMLEHLGLGRVLLRTRDVWPGAPGCSLTTTRALIARDPELVQSVVTAYVAGARRVATAPDEAARAGEEFIGISAAIVRRALAVNRPDVRAIRNDAAMAQIIALMTDLGYLERPPVDYRELRFLEAAEAAAEASAEAAAGQGGG
jgi:ABC-type nitrate/sulfonate/bicarbonate transport system substrate-binding protein